MEKKTNEKKIVEFHFENYRLINSMNNIKINQSIYKKIYKILWITSVAYFFSSDFRFIFFLLSFIQWKYRNWRNLRFIVHLLLVCCADIHRLLLLLMLLQKKVHLFHFTLWVKGISRRFLFFRHIVRPQNAATAAATSIKIK